jgi:Tfp pilus assembly protein PilF
MNLKVGCLLKILHTDKRNHIAIEQLALIYFSQNNYQAALKLFLKSLEIDSRNSNAYVGIVAVCLMYALENKIRFLNI